MDWFKELSAANVAIAVAGGIIGYLGKIFIDWLRYRLSMRTLQFGNLHSQKLLLYPKLLELINATIESLDSAVAKENKMNAKDLEKVSEKLKEFSILTNARLISDRKLARYLGAFKSRVAAVCGQLGLYAWLISKDMTEGLRYQPIEMDIQRLKVMRETIFNLLRREMGVGNV